MSRTEQIHRKFWDFIKLNGIDEVEFLNGWHARTRFDGNGGYPDDWDHNARYVYGRAWVDTGHTYTNYDGTSIRERVKKIIFKTYDRMDIDEAMTLIAEGVQVRNVIYFRKKYPIKFLEE